MVPTVYLCNNIVSALARGQGGPEQIAALDRILEAWQQGRLTLVTSVVTGQEVNRIPEQYRQPHRAIYQLLKRVPTTRERWTGLGLLLRVPGLARYDPLLAELRRVLEPTDARHVFQAIRAKADVFLTLDGGIISHGSYVARHGIRVLRPSELAGEIDGAADSARE